MRKFNISILVVAVFVIANLILITNLSKIGGRLVLEHDLPSTIDGIVVLSGGNGNRVELAADIYKGGISSKFIINGEEKFLWKSMPSFLADYALRLGVKRQDVVELTHARSTYENAITTLAYVQEHSIKTICIVTSKFHTRRSYRVFKRVFEGTEVMIYSAGAEDGIDYNNWWKDYEMASDVLQEWSKTIVYWFLY